MKCKYLVSAALLVCVATSVGAQSVKAGIDEWQKSDFSGAVSIWRPLAEHGDADAQFNLGQAYRLGRGVPIDLGAAKTWFERAASQGHVDAETTLGLLLFQNGDQAEGLKWLKKAADQGEARAQLVYGTALVNGDSVTQDPALGYAYVSRAAGGGLEAAKDTLQQLDRLLPASSRKHGLALARELGKRAAVTKVVEPKASPKPAETASIAKPPRVTGGVTSASKRLRTSLSDNEKPKPRPNPQAKSTPAIASTTKIDNAPAPAGHWRIQLGAFSRSANAEALYKKVSENPQVLGRKPFYVATGGITRLQIGPFESQVEATKACRTIGLACFAVPAK